MKSKIFLLFSALILLLPSSGCAGSARDIGGDKSYATDYVVGQTYRLKMPVFIERVSKELLLKKPGKMRSGPASLEEYKASDKSKWPDIVGLLESGTQIIIRKLELDKSFETGNIVWVKGEIRNGPAAGKVVELHFISKEIHQKKPLASVPTVDPTYLEPLNK